ncbi:DUF2024 family protein [Flavobacterium geliluteum]|uniref:DUF2024 family protein n=1 Tax=Flavobacterium geliluteum TaxID=2816120 RepID=A0A941AW15_9FLAO|nr:DUF2024 family protein [Flavobacterium geliluteum]MBP4139194.1 DUF2024 family protein [Flavobacterium geliluteum]
MKVAVWDTYVTRNDGKIMHFDILVEENVMEENIIFEYGKKYLKSVMQSTQNLTSKQCNFCHIDVVPEHMEKQIINNGYAIIEMENCY